MNVTKILSIVILLVSLGLAYYLGNSIKTTIDERAMISVREAEVIQKLQFIREAEIVYQEVNGNYTSDWDKLADFIRNGEYPIIQKKEHIITLAYGADSVIVEIDTLEVIPAKDRIFTASHNVLAANDGIINKFLVSVGDKVEQGNNAYELIQSGKYVTHKFRNNGKVTLIQDIPLGSQVEKGDILMTLLETKFNPNIDLNRLAYVPGYDDVKFDIYAAEVAKNNVMVDVIEVKNPKPFDPAKSEKNEAKNKKPLRFGSKTDVTTSGNWE